MEIISITVATTMYKIVAEMVIRVVAIHFSGRGSGEAKRYTFIAKPATPKAKPSQPPGIASSSGSAPHSHSYQRRCGKVFTLGIISQAWADEAGSILSFNDYSGKI